MLQAQQLFLSLPEEESLCIPFHLKIHLPARQTEGSSEIPADAVTGKPSQPASSAAVFPTPWKNPGARYQISCLGCSCPTHSLCPEQLCHPPAEQWDLGSAECRPLYQGCSARMPRPAQTCLQGFSPCAISCLTGCSISPSAASHRCSHPRGSALLLLPPPMFSHRGMLENPWVGMALLLFYPGNPSLPKSYQGDGKF